MGHYALTIKTDKLGAELISDAFFSCDCQGIHIEDNQSVEEAIGTDVLWDYIDDALIRAKTDNTVTLTGYFSTNDIIALQKKLRAVLSSYGLGEIYINAAQVENKEWYNDWKKFYQPLEVGRYAVVPAWQEYNAKEKIAIKIDPGTAFGTGEHESTQLVLGLASTLDLQEKSAYDIGCGSGILGIAVALSGASKVTLIDIDPIATKAATENVALNGLQDIKIICGAAPQGLAEKVDVIVANLTADLLVSLKQDLFNLLLDGGKLIASGIINSRQQEVQDALLGVGFGLVQFQRMGEWSGLLLERE